MIRVGIVGDIGSGKSYVAKKFGYPVFNADDEVKNLYKTNKNCFKKLNKFFPNYITSFPIKKNEVIATILKKKNSLKKIVKIIHPMVRHRMNNFIRKNKNRKIIILDIPLLLENKIENKKDIIVFVKSEKSKIIKKLKKRKNFNPLLIKKFMQIQLPIEYKIKKSDFIVRNNFNKKFLKKDINKILKKIL
tara:strand:+ start:1552 stop:2121 length:570 start_codon:yes stop_codon:yes gene_type:complete